MNYIRDFINSMDWHDEINELFDQFVEDINEIPFDYDYENTPEFLLNQSIVNNAYLLRRTIELRTPQETFRHSTIYNSDNEITPSTNINFSINSNINFIDDDIDVNHPYIQHLYSLLATNNLTDNLTDNSVLTSLFTNFNNFMEQNLDDLEDVKVTLSENEFDNLDIVEDKTLIENKQCNICLEELKEEEVNDRTLINLKCNHIYHKECIKEWLTKQSTKCPSCRFCCRTSINCE
jgi:hypothetical protein